MPVLACQQDLLHPYQESDHGPERPSIQFFGKGVGDFVLQKGIVVSRGASPAWEIATPGEFLVARLPPGR